MKVLWQKKELDFRENGVFMQGTKKVIHDNPDNVLADVQRSVSIQFKKNAE